MKTVYAVILNEYTDNCYTAGVFSTEEDSELYAKTAHLNGDYKIEKFIVDERSDFIKEGYKTYLITINIDDGYFSHFSMERDKIGNGKRVNIDRAEGVIYLEIFAKSDEEAKSIANKERLKVLEFLEEKV